MAFNFNWSPLTADAGFYTRAQELLTTALNKSPKPPIIVDDILVNELNLGNVPPDLDILEVGDIAEDRFRGIFKMSYNGDAFLTLKTKVQANPLNTYLLTRPAFAAPRPLAAASGLTIPLKITLSDIKLSAFIVLVFSKQKGLTLVFRNDPLESLKVSSTFDSIPFVRDFLQKEIEAQLRILLMDELPAIIHRLSLRLWVPEYRAQEDQELAKREAVDDEETLIDPLAAPPDDPVDATGNVLNPAEIASLPLDSIETHSLFSQKNLLRLAALNDSHRTLSLFTPSLNDTVFRAWAGPTEKGDLRSGFQSPRSPALPRSHSYSGSTVTASTFDSASVSRPGFPHSSSYNLSGPSNRHTKVPGARRRKRRVVNLRRRNTETGEMESVSGDGESYTTESGTPSASSAPPSAFGDHVPLVPETMEEEASAVHMPQNSSLRTHSPNLPTLRSRSSNEKFKTPPRQALAQSLGRESQETKERATPRRSQTTLDLDATPRASMYATEKPNLETSKCDAGPSSAPPTAPLRPPLPNFAQFLDPNNGSTILEQAWMLKMASEMARRYQEEKEGDAPPAYTG
ncbi:MAG: hypothetical protein Q9227_003148 [Pyrenula ochraceoflavens]